MNTETLTTINPTTKEWGHISYFHTLNEITFYAENNELRIKNVSHSDMILLMRNEICRKSENAIQNQDGLTKHDTELLREMYDSLKEHFTK